MNGWSNRETWLASVWGYAEIDREDVADILDDADTTRVVKIIRIANILEERCEDHLAELVTDELSSSLLGDLLRGAADQINWYELAETWYTDNA